MRLSQNSNFRAKTTFHRLEATQELEDMEPLFLLLLRRFHVPAGVRTLEEFGTLRGLIVAGTVECRNNKVF